MCSNKIDSNLESLLVLHEAVEILLIKYAKWILFGKSVDDFEYLIPLLSFCALFVLLFLLFHFFLLFELL